MCFFKRYCFFITHLFSVHHISAYIRYRGVVVAFVRVDVREIDGGRLDQRAFVDEDVLRVLAPFGRHEGGVDDADRLLAGLHVLELHVLFGRVRKHVPGFVARLQQGAEVLDVAGLRRLHLRHVVHVAGDVGAFLCGEGKRGCTKLPRSRTAPTGGVVTSSKLGGYFTETG